MQKLQIHRQRIWLLSRQQSIQSKKDIAWTIAGGPLLHDHDHFGVALLHDIDKHQERPAAFGWWSRIGRSWFHIHLVPDWTKWKGIFWSTGHYFLTKHQTFWKLTNSFKRWGGVNWVKAIFINFSHIWKDSNMEQSQLAFGAEIAEFSCFERKSESWSGADVWTKLNQVQRYGFDAAKMLFPNPIMKINCLWND